MLSFLMLSVLLLGTCLAIPPDPSQVAGEKDVNEELNQLKEKIHSLDKKLAFVENAFLTVHRARSFATGSEKLYTTNEQEGNFDAANAICIQAGGHIPSPKKEGEKKALQSVLERHNKSVYVLGNDSANWASGEPNNAGGTKNCVETNKDGLFRAASCEENHLIVCEFSFVP